ncbi:MAG: type II CRISPR RNA-guided endonuclease Cas9 [Verrucomicrobiales bacterium]
MKTKDGRIFFVYDRGTDPGKAAPGLLGLCYPRFDNRHPHVDLLTPSDEQGRPIHVARKNKPEAQESLFEQALLNFRVLDKATGKKVIPSSASLDALRQMYEAGRRKTVKESAKKVAKAANSITPLIATPSDVRNAVEIKVKTLEKWAQAHPEYALLEDQKELKASLGKGRARFCRANLKKLVEDFESIAQGDKEQSAWQPVLRSDGQSAAEAMNAFLSKIKHGLVQHRLRLFVKLLGNLSRQHGVPDHIVYETARTLSFGKTRREEEARKRGKFEKERQGSIDELRKERRSTSKNAILRFRLWKESGHHCPFCLDEITQADVFNGAVDIAHIYPKSLAPCNEQWNLTVACVKCNRHDMEDRIPREAYGNLDRWPRMEEHARKHFNGRKLELFLSPNREKAAEMVRPGGSLAQTGYIGKMVRQAALIHFSDSGWLHEGKDPTGQTNHPGVLSLKPSNGQITSALRKAWGLDSVLHPRQRRLTEAEELALTDDERIERDQTRMEIFQKNRGDHRHHAIDAMVLACTWPARALRIHEVTKEGVAQDQARKRRLGDDEGYFFWEAKRQQWLAAHPLYEDHREMRRTVERWCERLVGEDRIEHHRSKSNHKGGYKLNFLAKVNYRQPGERQAHQLNQAYYLRERVTKLTIKKILAANKDVPYIHPPEMKDYLAALWRSYAEDVEAFLLASADSFAKWAQSDERLNGLRNDEIIAEFRAGLCYGAFSRWQAGDTAAAATCRQKAQRRMTDDLDKKTFAHLVRPKDGTAWSIQWRGKSRKGQDPLPLRLSAFSKLPGDFTDRLCFSAFQRWRAQPDAATVEVPSRVVIPIRRLMMLVSADGGAMATVTGGDGISRFVPRKEYRQVEIVDGEDGGVVLVFVPFYKGDTAYAPFGSPKPGGKRHRVLRKGDLVKFPQAWGDPPSDVYILAALNPSGQPHLMLPHVANEKRAMAAFGHSSSGWKPGWPTVITALGLQPGWKIGTACGEAEYLEEEDADDSLD